MTDDRPRFRFRFGLAQLLLLVAIVGAVFGSYRFYWRADQGNICFLIGYFMALLAIITVRTLNRWTPDRGPWRVFVLFGWSYTLLLVYRSNQSGAIPRTLEYVSLGLVIGAIAALTSWVLFSIWDGPHSSQSDSHSNNLR